MTTASDNHGGEHSPSNVTNEIDRPLQKRKESSRIAHSCIKEINTQIADASGFLGGWRAGKVHLLCRSYCTKRCKELVSTLTHLWCEPISEPKTLTHNTTGRSNEVHGHRPVFSVKEHRGTAKTWDDSDGSGLADEMLFSTGVTAL